MTSPFLLGLVGAVGLAGLPGMAGAPELVASVAAVGERPLLLGDVLASAETHHPTIAVALAEQAVARGELLASEGAFDPSLRAKAIGDASYYSNLVGDVGVEVPTTLWGTTLQGGWRIGAGDYPIYDGKQKTNDGGEVRLGLLVPLLRDGPIDRRRATMERLTLEQEVQEQAVRVARLEIRRQAAFAYWDWAAAGALLVVAERQLALAETRDAQLSARAAAGDIPSIEQQDNARLVAQRRARRVSALRALEKAAIDLALFWREANGTPVMVDRRRLPTLDPPQEADSVPVASSLIDEALSRRPEMLRLVRTREQLGVDRRAAANQLLPGLALTAGVSQDLGGTSPPLSSSSSVWNPDPKTRAVPDVELGLSFELPVPLRQARGRLASLEAQQNRLEHATRLVRDRIALEVQDALSAERAAFRRVEAARDEVRAASRVEEAERVRFAAGDSTLLVVNLRESAQADAQVALVDATLDARRAEITRWAAAGRLLDDIPAGAGPQDASAAKTLPPVE